MRDSMLFNDRRFIVNFIEIYRNNPALWKVKSPEYLNRSLKKKGYNALINFCKQHYPKADKDAVAKKIQNLRGAFRKELKKVRTSEENGDVEVYEPQLWYFHLLQFTADQDDQSMNKSGNIEFVDIMEDEDTFAELEDVTNELNSVKAEVAPSTSVELLTDTKGKRKFPAEYQEQTVSNPFIIEEFEAVGVNVAAKLRRMNPTQQLLAEGLINTIVLKGMFGELSKDTVLSNN